MHESSFTTKQSHNQVVLISANCLTWYFGLNASHSFSSASDKLFQTALPFFIDMSSLSHGYLPFLLQLNWFLLSLSFYTPVYTPRSCEINSHLQHFNRPTDFSPYSFTRCSTLFLQWPSLSEYFWGFVLFSLCLECHFVSISTHRETHTALRGKYYPLLNPMAFSLYVSNPPSIPLELIIGYSRLYSTSYSLDYPV